MNKDNRFQLPFKSWLLYQVFNKYSGNDQKVRDLYAQYLGVSIKEIPVWIKQTYNYDRKMYYNDCKYNSRYYDRDNPINDIAQYWERQDKQSYSIDDIQRYFHEIGLSGQLNAVAMDFIAGYTINEIA